MVGCWSQGDGFAGLGFEWFKFTTSTNGGISGSCLSACPDVGQKERERSSARTIIKHEKGHQILDNSKQVTVGGFWRTT